jgi:hypothetical protein
VRSWRGGPSSPPSAHRKAGRQAREGAGCADTSFKFHLDRPQITNYTAHGADLGLPGADLG